MTLELNVDVKHAVLCVVSATGEIDLEAAPTLEEKLEEVVAAGRVDIVLDLTQAELSRRD